MFAIPPMGLSSKKKALPIGLIDSNSLVNAGSSTPSLALSNILAGDIIVGAGAKSGTGSGTNVTMTGFTYFHQQVWKNIVQNTFSTGYKIAVGGETSIQFGFGAAGGWLVGAVFRNASVAALQSSGIHQTTNTFNIGSHTESDDSSMSVLFGWLNINASNAPGAITEPSGYTLAVRGDGATAGGSFQDRLLSLWYRTYANLGAQSPTYQKANFDSSDSGYSNTKLSI